MQQGVFEEIRRFTREMHRVATSDPERPITFVVAYQMSDSKLMHLAAHTTGNFESIHLAAHYLQSFSGLINEPIEKSIVDCAPYRSQPVYRPVSEDHVNRCKEMRKFCDGFYTNSIRWNLQCFIILCEFPKELEGDIGTLFFPRHNGILIHNSDMTNNDVLPSFPRLVQIFEDKYA
jgi:hypothetical protein